MAARTTGTQPTGATGNTRVRFEQWAQNSSCQANTLSAVHNIKMAAIAIAEGIKPTSGQSPFALARGETFERDLLRSGAKRLVDELVYKGVLPEGASGLVDFRLAMNGGRLPSLEAAIEATEQLIRQLADGGSAFAAPSVVAGATVRIPRGVMLPEAILILDVLAIRADGPIPELVVGEVKTYPDRGGHTDPRSLAVARAQAGLYVHAIELLLDELGASDRIRLHRDGFLVLTRPGSNLPSVRAGEDLRFQAERARRGFELLEAAALGLPPFDPIGEDPEAAVKHAATDYHEACLTFCDRAEKCFREALAAGNPAVLGDDVTRFLGSITLDRALELLAGVAPATTAEKDLMRRVSELDRIAAR